ncbi:MAG: N-6 DNA methylase [Candidatus Accumulibacter sp. UW20]
MANVPEDELGNAYEFLIKKFADDSGHTAAGVLYESHRGPSHDAMLEPKPGESIYDPTCGTGGMLISALVEVKRSAANTARSSSTGRSATSSPPSIARMNLLLHGVEDSEIIRGDTLADPRHIAR